MVTLDLNELSIGHAISLAVLLAMTEESLKWGWVKGVMTELEDVESLIRTLG